jgi:hypothetical protein
MSGLLNRTAVRAFVLETFRRERPGMEMSRVDPATIDWYETYLRSVIRDDVMRHPTRGKTFTDLISRATKAV